MLKNILIPIDGTDNSKKAINTALDIADKTNAGIVAIHLVDDKLNIPYETLEDNANKMLLEVEELAKKRDINAITHLIFADPIRDISKAITKSNCELIILSAYGEKNNQIGRVAKTILKEVEIPILLIK